MYHIRDERIVLIYEALLLSFENLCVNFQYRSNKFLQIKKKEILLQSRYCPYL